MSVSGTMDHKCENCGAVLKFNPHNQNWVCEYCNSIFDKKEIEKIEKNRELKSDSVKSKLDSNEGVDIYTCSNCGAQIIADENTSATFCVYCKNTAILKNKLIGEFNPDKIIPFFKNKEDAIEVFTKLSKGKPLAPKEFTNKKNIQQMQGIYVPFWLYDYDVFGSININGTITTSWTTGSYRYTKTDIYSVEREGTMSFYKIPVDGSMRLDNYVMNSIEPYDYSALEDFHHSYLSGFFAEKYDVDSNTASYDALSRAYSSATNILKAGINNYSSIHINNTNHKAKVRDCKYALLPVWLLNIKYKDKIYTFAMNGQTGKMIGNIPVDKKKVIIYSILIFIAFVVTLSAIWYFVGV